MSDINPSRREREDSEKKRLENELRLMEMKYITEYQLRMQTAQDLWEMEKSRNSWKMFAILLLGALIFLLILFLGTR